MCRRGACRSQGIATMAVLNKDTAREDIERQERDEDAEGLRVTVQETEVPWSSIHSLLSGHKQGCGPGRSLAPQGLGRIL